MLSCLHLELLRLVRARPLASVAVGGGRYSVCYSPSGGSGFSPSNNRHHGGIGRFACSHTPQTIYDRDSRNNDLANSRSGVRELHIQSNTTLGAKRYVKAASCANGFPGVLMSRWPLRACCYRMCQAPGLPLPRRYRPAGGRAAPTLRSGRIRASAPSLICSSGISRQGCEARVTSCSPVRKYPAPGTQARTLVIPSTTSSTWVIVSSV
jgi:hypothetical protein